jgi:ABC-type nitrate/sulfonate/bicarbonate transport system substrate-binding protein
VAQGAAAAWLYVAQAEKLFDQCSLDVEVTQAQTSVQTSSYLSGGLPFAVVGGGFPGAVAATGRPLNVFGVLGAAPVFSMLSRSPVQGPDGLRGKVLAVLSPVDSTYKVALYYLEQQHVRPDEVRFNFLNTMPNIAAALESGAADLGVVSPPTVEVLEFRGLTRLADFTDAPIDNPTQPIVGDPSWVDKHPAAAANMMRAILTSVYHIKRDPARARGAVAAALNLDANTKEGSIAIEAALRAAQLNYRPMRDIMSVAPATVELFRSTAPPDIAQRLAGKDMNALLPAHDLGAQLLQDGFLAHLEKLYGPLPATG